NATGGARVGSAAGDPTPAAAGDGAPPGSDVAAMVARPRAATAVPGRRAAPRTPRRRPLPRRPAVGAWLPAGGPPPVRGRRAAGPLTPPRPSPAPPGRDGAARPLRGAGAAP